MSRLSKQQEERSLQQIRMDWTCLKDIPSRFS